MRSLPPFREIGKTNARWKAWRRIGNGQGEQFFLEHREAVLDTLESSHPPSEVLISFENYQSASQVWLERAEKKTEIAWYLVDSESLNKVVSVPNCSGVVGVYSPRETELSRLMEQSFLLVCWEVMDPGNLGTLLRSVNALTDGGVVFVGGCSPWSSKVARSSAGTLFRTPISRMSTDEGEQLLEALSSGNFQLWGTYPRGGVSPRAIEWNEKCAILLGNETRGLPPDLRERTRVISLPMSDGCESLNVAVLGSILCYEWQGQRMAPCHG